MHFNLNCRFYSKVYLIHVVPIFEFIRIQFKAIESRLRNQISVNYKFQSALIMQRDF